MIKPILITALLGGLSGCQVFDGLEQKAEAPIPRILVAKMKSKGMTAKSPIMLRIFKQENVLEVWKAKDTGRYALLTTYEICKWSGKFGPKFKEGDRQAPEGFYKINKHQFNPNSKYHLSFNMGFPNAYDRAHGRTGSHLMIHGACSSAGCYSMTDDRVEEIYALGREALRGGQKAFQVQAYPFRMTADNMVKHRDDKHYKFWTMLKKGYDHFEVTKVPPKVDVCGRRYEFNTESDRRYLSTQSCPPRRMPESVALAYTSRQNAFSKKFEMLLAKQEDRAAATLTPVSIETALPGISFTRPKPKVVAPTPETPNASVDTSKPETSQTATAPATGTATSPVASTTATEAPTASDEGAKPVLKKVETTPTTDG